MTRAEHLFEILGGLDDELVEEAAQPAPGVRRPPVWRRWAALAACLLLAAGVWRLGLGRMGGASGEGAADNDAAVPMATPMPSQSKLSEEIVSGGAGGPGAPSGKTGSEEERVGNVPEAAATYGEQFSATSGDAAGDANGEKAPMGDAPVLPSALPSPSVQPFQGQYDAALEGDVWLEELNQELARRVAEEGVPEALAVYVDGIAGEPRALLTPEEAWAAMGDGGTSNMELQKVGAEAVLRYVSDGEGGAYPCWRFTLPDGGTLDAPAVAAQ